MTLQDEPGVIFWAETAVTGIRATASAINNPLARLPLNRIPKGYWKDSTFGVLR